jgi:hypothetical protein
VNTTPNSRFIDSTAYSTRNDTRRPASARRSDALDSRANASSALDPSRRPRRGATIPASVSVFSTPGGACERENRRESGQFRAIGQPSRRHRATKSVGTTRERTPGAHGAAMMT